MTGLTLNPAAPGFRPARKPGPRPAPRVTKLPPPAPIDCDPVQVQLDLHSLNAQSHDLVTRFQRLRSSFHALTSLSSTVYNPALTTKDRDECLGFLLLEISTDVVGCFVLSCPSPADVKNKRARRALSRIRALFKMMWEAQTQTTRLLKRAVFVGARAELDRGVQCGNKLGGMIGKLQGFVEGLRGSSDVAGEEAGSAGALVGGVTDFLPQDDAEKDDSEDEDLDDVVFILEKPEAMVGELKSTVGKKTTQALDEEQDRIVDVSLCRAAGPGERGRRWSDSFDLLPPWVPNRRRLSAGVC